MTAGRVELEALAGCVPSEAIATRALPDGRSVPCVEPRDERQLAEVLALVRARRGVCRAVGGGARLGWEPLPERLDLLLATTALTGAVAYEPGDGTLTARAGERFDALEATVAAGGHHLSPSLAAPERTTLGGALAAGVSGLDRLRHGPMRHNVLGLRVMLADGTVARSGGRLVKNVTGYDLHRLYCGSFGTLGIVLEATLRLFPGPRRRALLRASFAEAATALSAAEALRADALEPEALRIERHADGRWELGLLLAGRVDVVEWELERAREHLPDPEVLVGDEEHEARRRWSALEGAVTDPHGHTAMPLLEAHTRPSRLGEMLRLAEAARDEDESSRETVAHPGLGRLLLLWNAPVSEAALPRLARLHRALVEAGARVRWRNVPGPLRRALDEAHLVPAIPAPARELMRRLKHALDPGHLFGPPLHALGEPRRATTAPVPTADA